MAKGVVYTKEEIVSLSLDLAGYSAGRQLLSTKLLDIGCGYGQFIGEAAKRLARYCANKGMMPRETLEIVNRNIRGVEISDVTARIARTRVTREVEAAYGHGPRNIDLSKAVITNADFLQWTPEPVKFDLIVGNLPYVRYDAISRLPKAKHVPFIKKKFHTFRGRADYSVAFLEKAVNLLSDTGRLSLITSNRFTQAEYGKEIRRFLVNSLGAIDELDLRNVGAFEEDVTAYASLFVSSKRKHAYYVVLGDMSKKTLSRLSKQGLANLDSSKYLKSHSRGRLPEDGSPWSPLTHSATDVIKRLALRHPRLDETGFNVAKGPATGANRVFIGTVGKFGFDLDTKEECLLPIYMSKKPTLKLGEPKYLLSVYEPGTSRLLALNEFPKEVSDYLYKHRAILKNRHIMKTGRKEWWRTIDQYDPSLREKTKILIPDLSRGDRIVLDRGSYMPSHTVLYVLGSEQKLGAILPILRSPVVDLLRMWMSPTMRSGTPRASSKIVSGIPIPENLTLDENSEVADVYDAYQLNRKEVTIIERAHKDAS